MVMAIIFWAFLLTSYFAVVYFGQRFERYFMVFLALCAALTLIVIYFFGFSGAQQYVLMIDGSILIFAIVLTSKLDVYWPIWFSGFQAITFATDLAWAIFPNAVPGIYQSAASFWALPALGAMTVGVFADYRARQPRS